MPEPPGPRPRPAAACELERLLTEVGEAAARRDVRVLLTVDELHTIDRRFDLPTLAGVLQLVTQRRGLPIALVGAGLPEVVDVLAGPTVTFLERLRKLELGYLTTDATRDVLLGPAQAAGRHLRAGGAQLLTRASSGYPYDVQLLGWETWAAAAAAGASSIDAGHARAGVRGAEVVVVEQVLEPRFRPARTPRAGLPDGDGRRRRRWHHHRRPRRPTGRHQRVRPLVPPGAPAAKHMIRAAGRGRVAFTLPGMAARLGAGTPRRSLPPPRS